MRLYTESVCCNVDLRLRNNCLDEIKYTANWFESDWKEFHDIS